MRASNTSNHKIPPIVLAFKLLASKHSEHLHVQNLSETSSFKPGYYYACTNYFHTSEAPPGTETKMKN